MRTYFESKNETHRIDLGDGQWIDILSVCSHRTRNKAMAATFKPSLAGVSKEAQVNMEFNAEAFNDVLIKEMVVDWSFVDGKGNKIPVTAENIDSLSADITQRIAEEIGKLNPTRTVQEKNAL